MWHIVIRFLCCHYFESLIISPCTVGQYYCYILSLIFFFSASGCPGAGCLLDIPTGGGTDTDRDCDRQRRRSHTRYSSGERHFFPIIVFSLLLLCSLSTLNSFVCTWIPGWRLRHRQLHQTHPHRWSRHHVLHPTAAEGTRGGDSSGAVPGDG